MATIEKKAPQFATRGTDRVRRREQQAAAKTVGEKELAALVVPSAAEKLAHAEQVKQQRAAQIAAAPTKRAQKKAAQAAVKVRAEQEAATVSSAVPTVLATLRPGEQVDYRTARLYMKEKQRLRRDEALEAGKAAGRAVRDLLRGRAVGANQQSRFRRLAQHAAAQAKQKQ